MSSPLRLAVIIPTLNEEATLAATLESLATQNEPANRIIVADSGSTDGTTTVAEKHGVSVIIAVKKGRGCQIAAALKHINEEIVLIVHADMIVPPEALARIRKKMTEDADCPGGCLGHRFDHPRRIYRWIEWCDARRARRGMSYGDQGQFYRRELLERHGGFPDQPSMEDVELSRRLSRLGSPAYLDCPVLVSARRFERLGPRRVIIRNWLFRLAYGWGGPRACEAIHRRYYGESPSVPRGKEADSLPTRRVSEGGPC
jgi:rSAM/selenodomain-associated transferase 2